ncbi:MULTISPECIES: 2-succinyl-5-enolpyruvyl-6-hydroxy-3-cyclohexene-1-carboxylic-acid synthase [unclassified Dysgonomonas]|jgi:2-succinyl-5-enolpyruvyl-6-hydroxy-3-cyclohexene-1-carboxylate synthase|uniref:2-succinyl-5-enolpyruvyl-6-hydroxy-3- cyclohexene-1-carboxylic-acid synthase n=1 Tax=unclassified Dysgonomonas TaxID=2630389 RepID=UPI0025C11A13|nr:MULTISPECIES: 2-succinyl-5-enolpyruvyl-6-hydroxy-3-cyclohexene-1-carboxylic-acid synthase [unclassified Dysgonomonas]HMM01728.1 2-succinyl-5-enolpyruvyl-6-hydroxy-3-cyclohexene-1-carboxylic-acid synthase [Dysgonomonas sp.]
MFSVKKNVLQTVAILKAYGIRHVVMSPGSRNAPLMQTFSQDSSFDCHVIVDERNAAFYALGIIQCTRKPVVICCTSGTALLNYAPAVAEAYYQQLPLIVVSADRSQEWIGQMDGQTLPQAGVFGSLVKKSVNLPEIETERDTWFCNRLINEALIDCMTDAQGPVHINVPISEPLFDYSVEKLPEVRKINLASIEKSVDTTPFSDKWNHLPKRMIIVGQLPKSPGLVKVLEKLVGRNDCIVLVEHPSNCVSPLFISNFDALLYAIPDEKKTDFVPDLVVTIGGHIVSKRLKQFLRGNKPVSHWHITPSGEVVDLFQSLTDLVETDNEKFLKALYNAISADEQRPYSGLWKEASEKITEPSSETPFSDIQAMGDFLKRLPGNSVLHLANSSTVRNAQLYLLDKSVNVFCNRGTNGIESSLSSAIGFASVYEGITYLVIGDLSFFYGLNSLWNISHIKNLRILLVNNGGGGIFHLLPGLNKAPSLKQYVAATHNTGAGEWVRASGMKYLSATNGEELSKAFETFMNETIQKSMVLEVITDMEVSKVVFKDYYHKLK